MSKQFYVYLLPADVEALINKLKSKLGVLLIHPFSSRPIPMELERPVCTNALMLEGEVVRVDCLLTRDRADIRMKFVPNLSRWSVQVGSEVIEFHGCEFDGRVLVRGRLYFQDDFLLQDMIAPKNAAFVTWANQVFRLAKKSLNRSRALDAYVGEHAQKWKEEGGRFAWMVTPERGPIFVDEEATHAG